MRPYRLRNTVLLKVLLAFVIAVPFTSALAGEGDQALMDSLLSTAGTEPTLQEIFDSLGYDIDVVNDELGWEQFCASGEDNVAILLDEISSSYYTASVGWYDADDSTDKTQLFGPSNQANDSITFTALGEDFVGFYFIPGISGGYTWYTNPAYNRDLFDHAKVYATGQNAAEYLVAFEDLKGGGDQDFNDFIMKVRFAEGSPIVELPADMYFEVCAEEMTCFDITAFDGNCTGAGGDLEIRMVMGPGDFTPVTGPSPLTATHCFWPYFESMTYTFVFKATNGDGLVGYDTLIVDYNINQVPDLVVPEDFDTVICSSKPVCFTVSGSDPDGDEIEFELLEGPGVIDPVTGEICFTPGEQDSADYMFVIRAADSCCTAKEADCIEPNCPPLCPVDTVVVTVVTVPAPYFVHVPVIDTALCEPATICFPVIAESPIGRPVIIEAEPPATYNEQTGEVCLYVDAEGIYEIEVTASDEECGVGDVDTARITVTLNSPPTVDLGDDTTLTLCEPVEYCFTATASDPDGDPLVFALESGPGVIDPQTGEVCFTPMKDSTYCIIVRAVDTCDSFDEDTVCIQVKMNDIPEISLGPDQNSNVCELGDTVCFPYTVSDPDGEDPVVTLFTANGIVKDGEICFVPDESGTFYFVVKATDSCGEFASDDIFITVTVNNPPELFVHDDDTVLLCDSEQICFENTAIDPDSLDNLTFEAISGIDIIFPGTGTVCFTPLSAGDYQLVLRVVDDCGVFDQDTINVHIVFNSPPSITGTNQQLQVNYCEEITDPGERCFFGIEVFDDDAGDVLTVSKISGPGIFYDDNLRTCFTPAQVDSTYEFCYRVSDGCGDFDEVCIDMDVIFVDSCVTDTSLCLTVSIEETAECVYNSSEIVLNIFADVQEAIGGFDLLIEYDITGFTFLSATPGPGLAGWEYFTFRYGPTDNCGGPCPDGLLRFVAITDINNGAAHPPPEAFYPEGSIVRVIFRVTNDVNFGGLFFQVRFFWVDCGDNSFSSIGGDSLFIDKLILNHNGIVWDEFDDFNYPETDRLPNIGAPDSCAVGAKVAPVRCVIFENGGICIISPDSIDLRGDINLNDLAYEIADVVLFTNYFIWGLGVFSINLQGQIAASDVNADGNALTVGDLVYLIRVLTGDALPIQKLSPYANHVNIEMQRTASRIELLSESSTEIGASYMVFDFDPSEVTPGAPILTDETSNMTMTYSIEDGTMRVLVYSYSMESINSGINSLVTIEIEGEGKFELVRSEFSDYDGNQLRVKEKTAETMPERFTLSQNYPNPFNPETEFELYLPYPSEWDVQIFNVAGQMVKNMSGYSGSGSVTVRWNGTDYDGRKVASGIYFYKATASEYSETRKMVLLK